MAWELDLNYIKDQIKDINERGERRRQYSADESKFWFDMPEGKSRTWFCFRVVGPYNSRGRLERTEWSCWLPKEIRKGPLISLKTWPELRIEDPIEKALQRLRERKVEFDNRLWPRPKVLTNIVLRKVDVDSRRVTAQWDKQREPLIAVLPASIWDAYMSSLAVMMGQTSPVNPANPDAGVDFYFSREGSGFDTKYSGAGFMVAMPTPVVSDPNDLRAVMAGIHNLDDLYPLPDESAITMHHEIANELMAHFGLGVTTVAMKSPPPPPMPSAEPLPAGWRSATHEGRTYYIGPDGKSQWEKPAFPIVEAPPPPPTQIVAAPAIVLSPPPTIVNHPPVMVGVIPPSQTTIPAIDHLPSATLPSGTTISAKADAVDFNDPAVDKAFSTGQWGQYDGNPVQPSQRKVEEYVQPKQGVTVPEPKKHCFGRDYDPRRTATMQGRQCFICPVELHCREVRIKQDVGYFSHIGWKIDGNSVVKMPDVAVMAK